MVVKVKEYFERQDKLKITTNPKNILYENKEIQDIMKKYYQIERYLIIPHITLKIDFLKRAISFSFN